VHRFSSSQSDNLLSLVEDGVFDLIGATTGNPSFVLTPALVPRMTVFRLEPLTVEDMKDVVARAVAHFKDKGISVNVEELALAQLTAHAGGDARRVLTAMDRLTANAAIGSTLAIKGEMVADLFQASPFCMTETPISTTTRSVPSSSRCVGLIPMRPFTGSQN
jgi:putative ATPase